MRDCSRLNRVEKDSKLLKKRDFFDKSRQNFQLFQKMDDLEKLEQLSLISKVSSELSNHLGVHDKVLAEFILHLHSESPDLDKFKLALGQVGADFPTSFIENLDRLIRTLKPAKKTSSEWEPEPSKVSNSKFPGLSIPDDSDRIKRMNEQELEESSQNASASVEKESQRRSRKRSRSPSPYSRRQDARSSHKREQTQKREQKIDDGPVMFKVYEGRVTGVKDFGAFISLNGIRQRTEGLVHISNLSSSRVGHPSDIVARDDKVFVKIITMEGNRIGLSMKDVDQASGKDLAPSGGLLGDSEYDSLRNPEKPLLSTNIKNSLLDSLNSKTGARKRLSSPERFEITQLIAAGVLNPRDYPELEEESGINGPIELEEEVDIEIREEEPLFLKGQTKTAIELSPIKIVKNPDGSMNRAAMNGATLAKERRDVRQQRAAEKEGKEEEDSGQAGRSSFKTDFRRKAQNNNVTYGKITSMTIREQRESLPIFKLRETLVKAIDENQVLIVVGDTGSGKVPFFNISDVPFRPPS